MNANHQLHEPSTDFVENLRVVPIGVEIDEWKLIGDVTSDDQRVGEQFKGYSISISSKLHVDKNAILSIALPFPTYDYYEFVASFKEGMKLGIEKWRQQLLLWQ
jgi:hypothetical protein